MIESIIIDILNRFAIEFDDMSTILVLIKRVFFFVAMLFDSQLDSITTILFNKFCRYMRFFEFDCIISNCYMFIVWLFLSNKLKIKYLESKITARIFEKIIKMIAFLWWLQSVQLIEIKFGVKIITWLYY